MKDIVSGNLKTGLPPVVDRNTRILVLGSLPGDASIRLQQYYGNPRNHFWTIIYSVLDGGRPDVEYSSRIMFLKSSGIGLWDVLRSADRKGSADSAIVKEIPNDITALLDQYPRIVQVLLNGTKARDSYRKYCKNARIQGMYVPSSSPRQGKNVLPLVLRIDKWREALSIAL